MQPEPARPRYAIAALVVIIVAGAIWAVSALLDYVLTLVTGVA